MKVLLVLKKKDLRLARAEAQALLGSTVILEREQYLVLETARPKLASRLSQAKEAYEILMISPPDEAKERLGMIQWSEHYKPPFSAKAEGVGFTAQDMAGVIWNSVPYPSVDLRQPKTVFAAFSAGDACVIGVRFWEHTDNGKARRPDLRPFHHPSSLEPVLARCMVNLAGKQRGEIVDPFCGSGGILIEAGLMGHSITGYDNNSIMAAGCRTNLAFFRLEGIVRTQDSLGLERALPSVVTDLPYAKNTKGKTEGLGTLYKGFFLLLKKRLKGRAVVGMPSDYPYKGSLSGLRIIHDFEWYIHKSLTKRIVVLERVSRRVA